MLIKSNKFLGAALLIVLGLFIVIAVVFQIKAMRNNNTPAPVATSTIPVTPQDIKNATSTTLTPAQKEKLTQMVLPWVENQGQFDPAVKFSVNNMAGTFFITSGDITYVFTQKEEVKKTSPEPVMPGEEEPPKVTTLVMKEFFAGDGVKFEPVGMDQQTAKANYFIGSKDNWKNNVTTYARIVSENVYPKVEVDIRAYGYGVAKSFTVKPGGNADQIKLRVDGISKMVINPDGRLKLQIKGTTDAKGVIYFGQPSAYQVINNTEQAVTAEYKLLGNNNYGFKIGDYNKEYPLVIK